MAEEIIMKYALPETIVSEGTLNRADLISAFTIELRYLLDQNPEHEDFHNMILLCEEADACETDTEAAGFILEDLFDTLDNFAPPGHYFGSSVGDGACFGFWSADDWVEAWNV